MRFDQKRFLISSKMEKKHRFWHKKTMYFIFGSACIIIIKLYCILNIYAGLILLISDFKTFLGKVSNEKVRIILEL